MSTGSSPAPRMPRKRQTARITTGGRCPPKISSSQYVDDEAEHDSDGSNGEENVDKYESDFIDDTVQEVEPIEWEDSPPPVVDDAEDSDGDAASNTEELRRSLLGIPRLLPLRWSLGADPELRPRPTANTGPILSQRWGQTSVPGIKSSAVRLGTDPGNTQGVLEVVRKSAGPVKVTMDEAEHAFVGSFTRNKSISSNAPRIIFRYIRYERVSQCVPGQTTALSFRSGHRRKCPCSDVTTPAAVGFHDAVDDDEMDDAPSVESEQTGDSTATEGTGNRKAEVSASLSKSAMKVANSTPKRKRPQNGESGQKAQGGRAGVAPSMLKPAVMDVAIQDPMMKPIYALQLPRLKKCQVTTWSSSEGPGMFELSYYPVINPKLSIDTVWALLLFVRKSVYINPARIDPRLLQARSPHYIKDGPKKRHPGFRADCRSMRNGFHLDLLHVQLHMSALTFGTKGIPIEQYEKLETKVQPGVKSSGNIYKKNTYVPLTTPLIGTIPCLSTMVASPDSTRPLT
ncbi:hypothetical protein B0H14DRAFT_2635324 [Mycena olivaceomarginata]|nr:hypothetical protein B0H14DRAFT_2635324 [Mycena olivaceomarginata]